MSPETTVILRTILFQLETAEDLDHALIAVKAMCSKDDVASVLEAVREWKEKDGNR